MGSQSLAFIPCIAGLSEDVRRVCRRYNIRTVSHSRARVGTSPNTVGGDQRAGPSEEHHHTAHQRGSTHSPHWFQADQQRRRCRYSGMLTSGPTMMSSTHTRKLMTVIQYCIIYDGTLDTTQHVTFLLVVTSVPVSN